MSQKHTKKTLPLGDRVIGTIWGIIILVGIGILWLYLYGSYFTILGEPAPITPLYAEGWIYASIWIFSFVGIIMTILLIVMMIRKYRGNALQLTIRSVLCQIGLYLLFLIVTPGYTIQLVPQIFGFTDLKAEYVTNTKMYFFWNSIIGDKYVKFYPYKSFQESLVGLSIADEKSDVSEYYGIIRDLLEVKKIPIELLLKEYQNNTFYTFFIYILSFDYGKEELYLPVLSNLAININDNYVRKNYENLHQEYYILKDEYLNNTNLFHEKKKELFESTLKKLYKIEGVNSSLKFQSQ